MNVKLPYSSTLLVFLMLISGRASVAQADLWYYLPTGTVYNQEIPTPASVIGHEVGEWHITHDKMANAGN
jgi:hypothetical protein